MVVGGGNGVANVVFVVFETLKVVGGGVDFCTDPLIDDFTVGISV